MGLCCSFPEWLSPEVLRVLSQSWGDSFTVWVCGAGAVGQEEEPTGSRPPQSLSQFPQLSAGPTRAPQSPMVFRQTWLAFVQLTGHQPHSAGGRWQLTWGPGCGGENGDERLIIPIEIRLQSDNVEPGFWADETGKMAVRTPAGVTCPPWGS